MFIGDYSAGPKRMSSSHGERERADAMSKKTFREARLRGPAHGVAEFPHVEIPPPPLFFVAYHHYATIQAL